MEKKTLTRCLYRDPIDDHQCYNRTTDPSGFCVAHEQEAIIAESIRATRLPRNVRRLLDDAIRAAQRERCSVDPAVQKEMALYLDTWVVRPLKRIERWADGHLNDWDLRS